jgi:hypothetical protein
LEIEGELRAMVGAKQYSRPENSDALSLHVEEVGCLEPFSFAHRAQPAKASRGELHQPKRKFIDRLLDGD